MYKANRKHYEVRNSTTNIEVEKIIKNSKVKEHFPKIKEIDYTIRGNFFFELGL